ncbi:MAG: 1-acyl-sn-glycerol-3-phosphate acyltransferase [Candidatus Riflebacteria bacterium]|nr:1-acyl-sn-glycerol-3-phosphate acyltransferase [Candidatus Riflebacteria bacterium]
MKDIFGTLKNRFTKLKEHVKFLLGPTGGHEPPYSETQPGKWTYFFTLKALTALYVTYFRLRIEDRRKLIQNRQCVVIANHASLVDGFLLAAIAHIPLNYMVKKESFDNPLLSIFMRKLYCFPVDRSKEVDMWAVKHSLKLLDEGKNLVIFPQGKRSFNGYISRFKPGAFKFAVKKKLPIVPVYISNTDKIALGNTIRPRFVKLGVHFLDPIETEEELKKGKTMEDISEMAYEAICTKASEVLGFDVRLDSED